MNPFLRIEQQRQKERGARNRLGYQFSDTDSAVRDAQRKGEHLVETVRQAGKDVRKRATALVNEVEAVLLRLSKKPNRRLAANEPDRRVWEIAYFENEISRLVRAYFGDISSLMADLQKLNPPLKSTQVDPYLNDMLADRRATLFNLEPLTKLIGELQRMKSTIVVDAPDDGSRVC